MFKLKAILFILFIEVISPRGYSGGLEEGAGEEKGIFCKDLPVLTALIDLPYQYMPDATLDEETRSQNSWSQNRHSPNIKVSKDGFILYRQAVLRRTDICTGAKSYTNGMHMWRIMWQKNEGRYSRHVKSRGKHAVIGIISEDEWTLTSNRRENLLGSKALSNNSFGWDINNNKIISNGIVLNNYPKEDNKYKISSDMAILLDMDKKKLGFFDIKNNKHLGDAVTDLKGTWSPAISTVYEHTVIYLKYCGSFKKQPLSLEEICKRSINKKLGTHPQKKIHDTDLPKPLQEYLLAPYQTPLDGSDERLLLVILLDHKRRNA